MIVMCRVWVLFLWLLILQDKLYSDGSRNQHVPWAAQDAGAAYNFVYVLDILGSL
jgi:hypothetical protein